MERRLDEKQLSVQSMEGKISFFDHSKISFETDAQGRPAGKYVKDHTGRKKCAVTAAEFYLEARFCSSMDRSSLRKRTYEFWLR